MEGVHPFSKKLWEGPWKLIRDPWSLISDPGVCSHRTFTRKRGMDGGGGGWAVHDLYLSSVYLQCNGRVVVDVLIMLTIMISFFYTYPLMIIRQIENTGKYLVNASLGKKFHSKNSLIFIYVDFFSFCHQQWIQIAPYYMLPSLLS